MGTIQNINTINHRISALHKNFGEDSPLYKKAISDLQTIFGKENTTTSKKTGAFRLKESKTNAQNELAIKGAIRRIPTPGEVKRNAKERYKETYGRSPKDKEELKDYINTIYSFNDWLDQNREEIYNLTRSGEPAANEIVNILNQSNKSYSELENIIDLWKDLINDD